MAHATNPSADIKAMLDDSGLRAVLVTENHDGSFLLHPVPHGSNVLNLQRDLLTHLNEYPVADDWLRQVRDYCDGRLNARADARKVKGIITPKPDARWEITPLAQVVG